jgi:hypothetical protein
MPMSGCKELEFMLTFSFLAKFKIAKIQQWKKLKFIDWKVEPGAKKDTHF